MNIILEISGGLGKSVMGVAVVSAIKKQYPEGNIIVVTAYPEVFINNPDVYRALPFGSLYFYENYVNSETRIFKMEPYQSEDYLKGKGHLIRIWCEIHGITYNGELPKIYLSDFELQKARAMKGKKPLMLIQPFGGANKDIKYSWNRDIPISQAQEIIKKYEDKYDIIQIAREDQPTVAKRFSSNFRDVAALIAVSDKRIFIDSFAQHTAASLELPSTVCWITNTPEMFGYKIHNNIQARKFDKDIRPIQSYLEKYDFTGSMTYQFPYKDENVFNLDEI